MTESHPEYEPDPIVEAVREKLRVRSLVGRRKYGTDMTRDDLDEIAWLRHFQEELLDAAVYTERLIFDLRKALSERT